MLTVLDAIKLSTEYLEKKGIDEARTNAELLLAGILNCKRLDLYLKFDRPLDEEETNNYRTYISKRGNFEPLQYILGETEFYGLKFKVDSSVLIPRPETEILVETVINNSKSKNKINVFDIGTGSGNIPVTLAKNISDSFITSIDISKKAIKTAEFNIELNEVKDKISLKNIDVFNDDVFTLGQFDIIVANPPYVEKDEIVNLQKEITGFEPLNAVTDNGDGYKFYKRIIEIAVTMLNQNGKIFFEFGKGQSEKVFELMKDNNFTDIKIVKDYQNIERIIYGKKL